MENFGIKYDWIYYDLLKINNQKNPEMNTSIKINEIN